MISHTKRAQTPEHDEFNSFMSTHKRVYSGFEEYVRRRAIFEDNLSFINAHNARGDSTYTLGVTRFADMELEEMQRIMNPRKFKTPAQVAAIKSTFRAADATHGPSSEPLPTSVNWWTAGAVNPPKDQGACGSCWTFGVAASLESAWKIKTGNLVSISEQQVLDCAWVPNGDSGCDGGFAEQGFQWIMRNGGIATEKSYHYLMVDGYCRAHDQSARVVVKGYVNITGGEPGLQSAVAKNPVAVAINASLKDFYFYFGGIYNNPACDPNNRDHEVTAVGYGTENGQDYWLVKNSWGVIWGEKGFVKMSRNRSNQCGISSEARYPLV